MSIQIRVNNQEGSILLSAQKGQLLSDILKEAGLAAVFPCGGKGKCGRCRIRAEGELEAPGRAERDFLGAELEQGIRLACMARAMGHCTLTLPDTRIEAVTQGLLSEYEKKPLYRKCGAAVDIGTTTVAAQLWLEGEPAGEGSVLNPQSVYGSDVISRIQAAMDGKLPELQQLIVKAVEKLLDSMSAKAGYAIETVVITGNTAMLHFLAGEDPTPLSAAPFQAKRLFGEWLSAEELGFEGELKKARVFLAPCFSAFVGGDIASAVLASGLMTKEETALLVDIGTNGEMALLKDGTLLCCSTAAGPVFEGAQISCGMQGKPGAIDRVYAEEGQLRYTTIGGVRAEGICGSGLVDCTAALLELELLEESGFMEEDAEIAPGVVLSPQDIRMVQLAKGAICAGIRTLCGTAGVSLQELQTLYVAGGFGAKLNIQSAAAIGMIPEELADKARVIGNAALAGASMMLQSEPMLEFCSRLAGQAKTLELSSNPLFAQLYMEAMMF